MINEFKPDGIFVDKQSHFGLDAIKEKIPLFVLLRGHYWSELEWAKKTIHNNFKDKIILWFKNRTAEKCFEQASAIFPISNYLIDIIKEHHPNQNTPVFFEGINHLALDSNKKMELKHPCVGLLQDANSWGKTKEMLILKNVLILSEKDKEKNYELMIQTYLTFNLNKILNADEEITESIVPEKAWSLVKSELIHKRNKLFFNRLLILAKKNVLFVAVGASHLAGDDGLLQQFFQAGFKKKSLIPFKK